MNYLDCMKYDQGPQVIMQPRAFCNAFADQDFDYVEIREHVPGLRSTVFAGSFAWKDGKITLFSDTDITNYFIIYGYTLFENDVDTLIDCHPVRKGVIVHTQRQGLRACLKSHDWFEGVILDHPQRFCDLFHNKDFDLVQVNCFMLNDVHFCGSFKWENNMIVSLDGDSYSDDVFVFGYEEFTNEEHNIAKGLSIYCYTL